jgi:hypothetical protein
MPSTSEHFNGIIQAITDYSEDTIEASGYNLKKLV